jgi:hypothetical protein
VKLVILRIMNRLFRHYEYANANANAPDCILSSFSSNFRHLIIKMPLPVCANSPNKVILPYS